MRCASFTSEAWTGDGLLLLFQTVYSTVPFYFSLPTIPRPAPPPFKVFLSLITAVSQPPHGTGFPLCLCSSAQFVCCLSLCKCVLSLSDFCTPQLLLSLRVPFSCPFKYLLPLSVGLFSLSSRMDRPPSSYEISGGWRIRQACDPFV